MGKLVPGRDKISEAWIKKQVKKILAYGNNLHYWMPSASQYGVSGQHDFLVCHNSLCWTVETKIAKKVPTDNQIVFANKIRDAGGLSLLINEFNLDDVIRVMVYVDTWRRLPMFLNHDFNQYSK